MQTLLDIWEAAQRNRAKLAGCPSHDFPLAKREPTRTCRNCGGEMWFDDAMRMQGRGGLADAVDNV